VDNHNFMSKIRELLERADNRNWSTMIDIWASKFEYTGSKYKIENKLRSTDMKTSPHKGVTWDKRNAKWRARYWNGRNHISLGLYEDEDQAKSAIDDYEEMTGGRGA